MYFGNHSLFESVSSQMSNGSVYHHFMSFRPVEVRDSRKGYFIPVRSGIGVWPDGKILDAPSPPPSSASSGNQGHIQARKLYLEFLLWFGGRGERYLRMGTGVLHRILIRIS